MQSTFDKNDHYYECRAQLRNLSLQFYTVTPSRDNSAQRFLSYIDELIISVRNGTLRLSHVPRNEDRQSLDRVQTQITILFHSILKFTFHGTFVHETVWRLCNHWLVICRLHAFQVWLSQPTSVSGYPALTLGAWLKEELYLNCIALHSDSRQCRSSILIDRLFDLEVYRTCRPATALSLYHRLNEFFSVLYDNIVIKYSLAANLQAIIEIEAQTRLLSHDIRDLKNIVSTLFVGRKLVKRWPAFMKICWSSTLLIGFLVVAIMAYLSLPWVDNFKREHILKLVSICLSISFVSLATYLFTAATGTNTAIAPEVVCCDSDRLLRHLTAHLCGYQTRSRGLCLRLSMQSTWCGLLKHDGQLLSVYRQLAQDVAGRTLSNQVPDF